MSLRSTSKRRFVNSDRFISHSVVIKYDNYNCTYAQPAERTDLWRYFSTSSRAPALWPRSSERNEAIQRTTCEMLLHRRLRRRRDAPYRVADVVSNQQRALLVDPDADRASLRLAAV